MIPIGPLLEPPSANDRTDLRKKILFWWRQASTTELTAMQFEMRRIILFTSNMDSMSRFYRDVIGLEVASNGDGNWQEYRAGACNIALHRGKSSVGGRAPKLVFYAADVAAARAELVRRGTVAIGKVISTDRFDMCDGKDPDGNPFQISSRK